MTIIPITQHPQYSALTESITELNSVKNKLLIRRTEVDSLIRCQAPDESTSVLDAAFKSANGQTTISVGIPDNLREERAELTKQIGVVSKVLLAREQERDTMVSGLSRDACASVEPQHREIAGRFIATLRQLDGIFEDEHQLLHSLSMAGYSQTFSRYVGWPYVGRLGHVGETALWNKHKELKDYASSKR